MATESKEEMFAFSTLKLAKDLVVMPTDSSTVKKSKRDRGFYVDGWDSPEMVNALARYSLERGLRLLLSEEMFDPLLILTANDHPFLDEMRLKDWQLRMSLLFGAKAKISRYEKLIAGEEKEREGTAVADCRKAIEILERFKENLLQRVSPPPRDIRNR